jgi:hypothetical protein
MPLEEFLQLCLIAAKQLLMFGGEIIGQEPLKYQAELRLVHLACVQGYLR